MKIPVWFNRGYRLALAFTADAGNKGLACDCFEGRRLWYAGLVRWVSPTHVAVTTKGLSLLYALEAAGKLKR